MEKKPVPWQKFLLLTPCIMKMNWQQKKKYRTFIKRYLPAGEKIDLLLTGENGDNRLLKCYSSCESVVNDDVTIARFKHMSGEFPTAIAMGLCPLLRTSSKTSHAAPHAQKKRRSGEI
jgi:hypothetical protein